MAKKKVRPAATKKQPAGRPTSTAARKTQGKGKSASGAATSGQGRLLPPSDGVVVRFYRIGHGDCFLLAFAGDQPEQPVYVLIDCGFKPGSPDKLPVATSAAEIWENIRTATGGHLDVAIITHEHQDHVNGITPKNLGDLTIGETWLAWTEDPTDSVANRLRAVYQDKLRGLVAAQNRLQAAGDTEQVQAIKDLLEFELGDDADSLLADHSLSAGNEGGSLRGNKGSMALFKRLASKGVKFFRPHQKIVPLPGAKQVRVYPLGPPRKQDLLEDLDPTGGEEFPDHALAVASPGNYFAAAAQATGSRPVQPLFEASYAIPLDSAANDLQFEVFFRSHYHGSQDLPESAALDGSEDESHPCALWRRIDLDWLRSAGQLALDLNSYTNNTSLVLAFELGRGGKVLLFAADAQRGNWISWANHDFEEGRRKVKVRDLLARTVLYKVGHHGSHNATLHGRVQDDYANIGWMGLNEHAEEFTALITAVRAWAETQKGWNHPYPPIKEFLLKKSSGRVLQTDTDLEQMPEPTDDTSRAWKKFQNRIKGCPLYFDYTVSR